MSAQNDKLLFIHIPKTGGSWAFEAMQAAGVKLERVFKPDSSITAMYHPSVEDLRIGNRFSFAFVREPLSWYRSTYKYRRRMRFNDGGELDPWLDLDFPHFLEAVIEQRPGFLAGVYEDFIPHEIDYVGRFEHLKDDLVSALELAGQDFNEKVLRNHPAINVSGHKDLDVPVELSMRLIESEAEIYRRYYSPVRFGRVGRECMADL